MYNPIFQALGFGLTKVLLLISVLYLIYNKTARNFLFYFKSEFVITILIIIYILPFVFFGNGTATVLPYQHFI